ncbi:hypothetical protein TRVA0_042S00232 [Trichomonascus vanleenenianus]|uniref:putative asparagine synthase n=1 Tax=Trichomonascus vanleenenianus TaxID=2268995 RepID=UPI003ECB8BA6
MCGILFCLSDHASEKSSRYAQLKPLIAKRGPTGIGEKVISTGQPGQKLRFFSSVLSLRLPYTKQPVSDQDCVLQFNGELYNSDIAGCDTSYLFNRLKRDGVLATLNEIRGEYAFVYYERSARKVWFGRDSIGRRSLMYSHSAGELLITSASDVNCQLLEALGGNIYCYSADEDHLRVIQWGNNGLLYPYGVTNGTVAEHNDDKQLPLELEQKLISSLTRRVETIPPSESTRIAILFSGGIDCTLVASLVDDILPGDEKVDLLNVAFENRRTNDGYATPDRRLGRQSWAELNSSRFRFVEIDVPFDEMMDHRKLVTALMKPKNSVMDLSIAIAFYFASRGRGVAYDAPESAGYEYESRAPVLLSGLGADELFGGYTRHTTQLQRNGYGGLVEELQLDFGRLHERNLGRDDRVCTIWGKELRYPFLDESLVCWALEDCPLNYKVNPQGETKYILRSIARNRNLPLVSLEKKRAIQFGAKSAKMEPGQRKVKGTDLL